jgi:hypothetical protein
MSTRDSVSAPSLMVFDTNLCIARRYPGRTEDRRGGYVVRALKKKKEKITTTFGRPLLTGVPFPALPLLPSMRLAGSVPETAQLSGASNDLHEVLAPRNVRAAGLYVSSMTACSI